MLSHMSMARIIVKKPVLRNAPVFILRERDTKHLFLKTYLYLLNEEITETAHCSILIVNDPNTGGGCS